MTPTPLPILIRLWFSPEANLYFPKTPHDCRALLEAGWTNIPCFTPPGSTRPGLNSIDQLYGFLQIQNRPYKLQLGNYLPAHLDMARAHGQTEGEPPPESPTAA
jgi:hypothetical protein